MELVKTREVDAVELPRWFLEWQDEVEGLFNQVIDLYHEESSTIDDLGDLPKFQQPIEPKTNWTAKEEPREISTPWLPTLDASLGFYCGAISSFFTMMLKRNKRNKLNSVLIYRVRPSVTSRVISPPGMQKFSVYARVAVAGIPRKTEAE